MSFQDGDGWVGGFGGGKQLPNPPGLILRALRSGALVNLTADGRTLSSTAKQVSEFLSSLPDAGASSAAAWGGSGARGNEALTVPTQVRALWSGVGPGVGHAARGKGFTVRSAQQPASALNSEALSTEPVDTPLSPHLSKHAHIFPHLSTRRSTTSARAATCTPTQATSCTAART